MRLSELLRRAGVEPLGPLPADPDLNGVSESTRELAPGALFVARRGETHDGHAFLAEAAARGAAAAIVEREVSPSPGLPLVRVADAREALGLLSAAFHGHPSGRIDLVGVTGTDGKTTVSHLVANILRAAGRETALVTSIGAEVGGETTPTENTTPPPPMLQRLLARAADRGCAHAVMEVSSHAVVQRRVAGCDFTGGVLTNVAEDHLDLHPTPEDYQAAKRRFFTEWLEDPADGRARWKALNADDAIGRELAALDRARTITYGLDRPADVTARRVEAGRRSLAFVLDLPGGSLPVRMRLTGAYNVRNALAAACAGLACDVPAEAIREGLEAFTGVPGRFEYVDGNLPFEVVIDYAHTPQAVEAVTEEGRRLAEGRLLVVFSSPGRRWAGKRAQMGALVGARADLAVVTTDNPGGEDPAAIAEDIAGGLRRTPPREGYLVELDRARAVELALASARPGDLVLLLGKGHEEYQILDGRRVPFSERSVVHAFAARNGHAVRG